jgi:hypothetical protein
VGRKRPWGQMNYLFSALFRSACGVQSKNYILYIPLSPLQKLFFPSGILQILVFTHLFPFTCATFATFAYFTVLIAFSLYMSSSFLSFHIFCLFIFLLSCFPSRMTSADILPGGRRSYFPIKWKRLSDFFPFFCPLFVQFLFYM